MFFNKQINSAEYEKISKDLVGIIQKISEFDSRIAAIETNVRSLRGLINRKIPAEQEQQVNSLGLPVSSNMKNGIF